MAKAAVASELLSYCTHCKLDLNHVVVAIKGERVAKVQCLTCKKEHVYRIPKSATPATKPSARAKKASDAEETLAHSIEVEWERLMNSHREVPIKAYGMKVHYGLGDKIHHKTFGDGIVGKLIYPNKIEVIFRTDIKVLLHAAVH